jgi:hypothetical protein
LEHGLRMIIDQDLIGHRLVNLLKCVSHVSSNLDLRKFHVTSFVILICVTSFFVSSVCEEERSQKKSTATSHLRGIQGRVRARVP